MAWRERSGKLGDNSANAILYALRDVDDEFRKLLPRPVTADDFEKLYDRLMAFGGRRGQGLAPKTIKNLHSVLRQAFNFARREELIGRNPVLLAEPPAVVAPRKLPWNRSQWATFTTHEAITGDRLAALWRLLAVTATREREVLGLRWPDVDLDQRFLTLKNSVVRKPNQGVVLRLGTLKSNASRRPPGLDPETVRVLRVHRIRQVEERLACPGWEDHDLVFTREDGSPLAPEWLTRRFNALVEQAGLPPTGTVGRYGPHGLRYTRASNASALVEHPTVTGAVLGRSYQSPTTQSVCTRVPLEDLRKAAGNVARVLADE